MPTVKPQLPTALYAKEEVWEHWEGSATDIARIARRVERWMSKHWVNFSVLPKEHWYIPGTGEVAQQNALVQYNTVRTSRWVGGASSEYLADEINARRELVRGVSIDSQVIYRAWYRDNVFETIPQREMPPPGPYQPGISITTDTVSPPHRVVIEFDTEAPAARLRVVAPSPQLVDGLFDYMRPHIAAGARPGLWSRRRAALAGEFLGVVGGAAVGVFVLAPAGVGLALLLGATLGTAGDQLVCWASPPLELVDSGERRRWSLVRTYAWQLTLFLLALASVLIAVLLA